MRSQSRVRGVVLAGLVGVGVAAMLIAPGSAQQPPPQGRGAGAAGGGARGGGGFASNFTGTINVVASDEMRMSRIRFDAGARTNWHLHSTAQLIVIEEGRGRMQERGEAVRDLPQGQPVYTKANVPHWHGAAPGEAALQFSVYSGELTWQEPVTDEQYKGAQ